MTRKLRFGAVAVLLFTLLGTGASASGSRDKDDDDIKIVRVTEIIVQEAEIDLGEPGDDHSRSLDFTGTLHVTPDCSTLARSDRRGWEATPSEIAAAVSLCEKCAPSMTGVGPPEQEAES